MMAVHTVLWAKIGILLLIQKYYLGRLIFVDFDDIIFSTGSILNATFQYRPYILLNLYQTSFSYVVVGGANFIQKSSTFIIISYQ